MWQSFLNWLKRIFKRQPATTDARQNENQQAAQTYENIAVNFNVAVAAASALADLTTVDSVPTVDGNNARAELMQDYANAVWDRLTAITARAYGTGGVFIKPATFRGRIVPQFIGQERYIPISNTAGIVTSAAFESEYAVVNDVMYTRVEIDILSENGVYTIEQKAKEGEKEVPLSTVPQWANYKPQISISNVDRMLYGFIKCPTDNRGDFSDPYGVPVTHGQKRLVEIANSFIDWLEKEVTLKKVRMGGDKSLFGSDGTEAGKKEAKKQIDEQLAEIFILFPGDENRKWFEVYNPELREQNVINALNFIFALLEKGMGLSKGVLTDLETADATATAIKRSTFATYAKVKAMQKNIETALRDYLYACDVIANVNGYSPRGEWEFKAEWSYSLLEDSGESWRQLLDAVGAGAARPEELRMWLFNEDEETAKANLPEIERLLSAE